MRSMMLGGLMLGGVVLSGCTMATVVPEASTEFKATGEIMAYAQSAAFDSVRVRGPKINMTKRTDGSWGGTLNDRAVDVSVDEAHVRGVELTLSREDSRGGHQVITGQFRGQIVRFEWDENRALVRTPTKSLTFDGRVVADNVVKYGPMQNFEFRGEAGLEKAPWPQVAFALVGAFQ